MLRKNDAKLRCLAQGIHVVQEHLHIARMFSLQAKSSRQKGKY